MTEFTKEDIELLSEYITNPTGRIFCVQGLPGIIGAAYTRYSRAKGGFREIFLNEFIKEGLLDHERADNLIERVLIQFGDESVQELENTYLSLEQVSNLITKLTEDRRIGGSPLEQSSRYVYYDQKDDEGNFRYYKDPNIMDSRYADEFIGTMDLAFQTYSDCIKPMKEFLKRLKPMEEAEYEIRKGKGNQKLKELKDKREIKDFRRTYNFDLKTKACDIVRVLLPAATLTNVCFLGNGRFFEKMLTKLYSDELSEAKEVATEAHVELNKIIPKYVKRAKRDPYLVTIAYNMVGLASRIFHNINPEEEENVVLLENNPNQFLNTTIAQMLYPYSKYPLRQIIGIVNDFSEDFKQEVIDTYIGNRKTKFNRPGRALEYGYPLTFDLIGNFGIYRDLHRHRMLTQERQELSTRLGFDMPDEIIEAGLVNKVENVRDKAVDLYEKLVLELPKEAQYTVLFGFNIRWTMGMNFREAMHMWELRTIPQGHPIYRKMCQKMHTLAKQNPQYGKLADAMQHVDYNDYFWSRAESEAKQRAKEALLKENRK